MLNEELVFINELIIDKGDWVATGTWKCLVVTADVGNDSDKLAELVGFLLVDFEWLWPVLRDDHAVGPAEALPDCFGDEWREWVKHDEELLESLLDERRVLPELFTFDKPVGIAIPDEVVDEVASFCKAVVFDELLELLAGLVELVANPVFAEALALVVSIVWIFVDELLSEAGDVPDFVTEVAASNDLAATEGLVNACAAAGDEAEAERIGAVLTNDVEWVDNVALGL